MGRVCPTRGSGRLAQLLDIQAWGSSRSGSLINGIIPPSWCMCALQLHRVATWTDPFASLWECLSLELMSEPLNYHQTATMTIICWIPISIHWDLCQLILLDLSVLGASCHSRGLNMGVLYFWKVIYQDVFTMYCNESHHRDSIDIKQQVLLVQSVSYLLSQHQMQVNPFVHHCWLQLATRDWELQSYTGFSLCQMGWFNL